ncbi:MAG: PAC2 family protein [Actinomycetota bacterium]
MAAPEDPLNHHSHPTLRDPILLASFKGWNDAGEAASFATSHLARVWAAEPIASVDPEEFYDFQANRPTVELVDGVTRRISWPSNEFLAARLDGAPHDVILMMGTEPSTRWRTFSGLVVEMVRRYEVKLVVTLGALLTDIPHSRLTHITATAVDPDLIDRLKLDRSRYEGPTGIVGVLHDALARAGVTSASLWAAVPHYLAVTPNPKAALALIGKVTELIGAPADLGTLEAAAVSYDERVAEMVASDDDVQAYVRLLEERADGRDQAEEMDPSKLPSGDAIAAEVERFLRDRHESGSD